MASDWDPRIAREQLGNILDRPYEHKNWQNCDAVIALLPSALQPPYGRATISVEDVLKRLFECLFAPGDQASDGSKEHALKPEMRAARAYLGWIDNEYELICQINQEAPSKRYKAPGDNASDQEREAFRVNILKSPEVRRKLAARQMDPGLSTKQFKNSRRGQIADALITAIRIFMRNQASVDALASEFGIKRPTASVAPEPPTEAMSPVGETEPRVESAMPIEEILPAKTETPPPSPSYHRSPGLARRYLIAAALCLVVGGIVAISWIVIAGHTGGKGTGQTDANGTTGQNNSSAQTIPVSITDPPKLSPAASVSRDITVVGAGTSEPPGYHRWIFVHADDGMYYPQGGTESLGDGFWAIPDVTIGASGSDDIGHDFIVYVLQVDDSTDSEIRNFMQPLSAGHAAYSEADWTSKFLRFKVDQVTVERTGCACPTATS